MLKGFDIRFSLLKPYQDAKENCLFKKPYTRCTRNSGTDDISCLMDKKDILLRFLNETNKWNDVILVFEKILKLQKINADNSMEIQYLIGLKNYYEQDNISYYIREIYDDFKKIYDRVLNIDNYKNYYDKLDQLIALRADLLRYGRSFASWINFYQITCLLIKFRRKDEYLRVIEMYTDYENKKELEETLRKSQYIAKHYYIMEYLIISYMNTGQYRHAMHVMKAIYNNFGLPLLCDKVTDLVRSELFNKHLKLWTDLRIEDRVVIIILRVNVAICYEHLSQRRLALGELEYIKNNHINPTMKGWHDSRGNWVAIEKCQSSSTSNITLLLNQQFSAGFHRGLDHRIDTIKEIRRVNKIKRMVRLNCDDMVVRIVEQYI